MDNKNKKHFGIFVESEMHRKLSYIAGYEGRSINGQIRFLIAEYIRNFEQKHGKIE